jgi:hypothetical protein
MLNHRWTIEKRVQFSQKCKGANNPNWKGNNVGYAALHEWIGNRKLTPLFCEECKQKSRLDLANISGKYLRDVTDWRWICRRCHMKSDGRLDKLRQMQPEVSKIGRLHSLQKPKSQETRWKMGSANRGVKFSKERCKHISEGHKGLKFTAEHCKHISEAKRRHKKLD